MTTIEAVLSGGVLPAAALQRQLGVSPATLMRTVRNSPEVVRFGRARATRYAWQQRWINLDASRFPVLQIDAGGRAESVGHLVTLAARQTVWLPAGTLYHGLPLAISDARPSGFLGRHFALQHADLRLPARLTDWSDHHVLLAMSRRGEDLPGNLLIGDESFARWQALPLNSHARSDYPMLADATIAGHPPGSSAGGERPKFGVLAGERHLLVKFAARGPDMAARRWCDLLVLESLALQVVTQHGIDGARTDFIESDRYCFLESERFDRIGARGRAAVLSLAAAHDDLADNWSRAAVRLLERGRISEEDSRRLRWLDAFGAFIANTDRHHYNIVFFPRDGALTLAPAFDQVAMQYAPSADGQVQSNPMPLPVQTAETLDVWESARAAASEVWLRATDDDRLSDDMRRVAGLNLNVLRA